MAYVIRTKFHLQKINTTTDTEYIKQIYIKNKNWNPDPAPLQIEDNITNLEKTLKENHNNLSQRLQNRNLRNLTYTKSNTLRELKQDKHLTIKPTDKNLGPAVLETETYVTQILTEHLLTKDYERLSETTAKNRLSDIAHTLKLIISNSQSRLPKAEYTYFQ